MTDLTEEVAARLPEEGVTADAHEQFIIVETEARGTELWFSFDGPRPKCGVWIDEEWTGDFLFPCTLEASEMVRKIAIISRAFK